MYHDDTMKSFFRRMCFSADGNLLFTPAGCLDIDTKTQNVSYIYKKNSYNRWVSFVCDYVVREFLFFNVFEFCSKRPCLYLPHDKPSVAVSVCPLKFQLYQSNLFKQLLLNKLYFYSLLGSISSH